MSGKSENKPVLANNGGALLEILLESRHEGNTVGSLRDPVTTESGSSAKIGSRTRVSPKARPTRQSSREDVDKEFASYLSGYIDGEGCFSVSLNPRDQLRSRWEVRPSFSVSQNADRAAFLYEIQRYFGCGTIRPDRSDRTIKYEVRSIHDLVARIIPHFAQFPLRSEKQRSFLLFAGVCRQVANGEHRSEGGIATIFEKAAAINGGKRKYLPGRKL